MKKVLDGSHQHAVVEALLYDKGEPEFIQQCKDDFNKRAKLMVSTSEVDQEASRINLQSLADFKAGKTKTLN